MDDKLIALMHHTKPCHYDDEWMREFEAEQERHLYHVHTGGGKYERRFSMNNSVELGYIYRYSSLSLNAIKIAH